MTENGFLVGGMGGVISTETHFILIQHWMNLFISAGLAKLWDLAIEVSSHMGSLHKQMHASLNLVVPLW